MADISTITSVPDYPAVADVKKDVVYGNGALTGLLAASAPSLPKTGQTTSYADYDDGYYKVGNPVDPRFTDNGDGTISDNATGLMWVKQPELIIPGAVGVHATNQIQVAKGTWAAETAYAKGDLIDDGMLLFVCAVAHTSGAVDFYTDFDAHPTYWRETVWKASSADLTTTSRMTWADAVSNSAALEYAGFSDWRLPNINELFSLTDQPTGINATYFPNDQGGVANYWSSTTYGSDAVSAGMSSGYYINPAPKFLSMFPRPVRGGI
jgi:hypothetical protein